MTQGSSRDQRQVPPLIVMPRSDTKRSRINSNNSEGSSGSRDSPAITNLAQGEFFMDRQQHSSHNHNHNHNHNHHSPSHHDGAHTNGHTPTPSCSSASSSRSPDPARFSQSMSRENRGSEKSNSSSNGGGGGGGRGGHSRDGSRKSKTQKDTLNVVNINITHASSTSSMSRPSASPLHGRRTPNINNNSHSRSKFSVNSREGNDSNSSSNFNITAADNGGGGGGGGHHHHHHHHHSGMRGDDDDDDDDDNTATNFSMGRRRSSMPNVSDMSYIKVPTEGEHRDTRLRRVRSFKTTSKGAVVNRGDSFKKKSTHSLRNAGCNATEARQLEQQILLQQQLQQQQQQQQQLFQQDELVDDPYAVEAAPIPVPTYFRVIMMGAADTGKSTLAKQFMTSDFVGSTEDESSQENSVAVLLDGEESTIQVIDPVDRNVIEEGLQQVLDAYVVVFAINDHATFMVAQELVRYLRVDFGTDRIILLVGNKTDLVRKRKVSPEDARLVCETYDCKFTEASAVLNHGVDELLVGVLTQIRLHMRIPFTTISFPGKEHRRDGRDNHRRSCKGPRKFFSKLFRRGSRKKLRPCENLHAL